MLSLNLGHWLTILLDIALKSALVSALALAALLSLRRAPATTRHLALLAGLGVLLGLPALTALLPRQALPLTVGAPSGLTGSVTGLNPHAVKVQVPAFAGEDFKSTPLPAKVGNRFTEARGFSPVTGPVTTQAPPKPPPVRPAWLVTLWLLGALACAGRTLAAQTQVWRLTRRCPRLPLTAPESASFSALKSGPAGAPPMVWGWPRATLLLPPESAAWPQTRLRAVLLHEAAHVRRQDWLTQTLTQAACALYWFNPLVWLLAARLHCEAERAADDAVLLAGVPPADYAQDLLAVARALSTNGRQGGVSLAAVTMARRSSVRGRLEAILDARRPRRRLTRRDAVFAFAVALTVAAPLAALRPAARADEAPASQAAPAPGVPTEADVARVQRHLQSLEEARAEYATAHPNTLMAAQVADVDRLIQAQERKHEQENFDAFEAANNKRFRAEAKKPHTRQERERLWGPIFAYEHISPIVIKRRHIEALRFDLLSAKVAPLPAGQKARETGLYASDDRIALDKTQIEAMQMERAEGYSLHISSDALTTYARDGFWQERTGVGSRAGWVLTELLNNKLHQERHLSDADVDSLATLLREPSAASSVNLISVLALFRDMHSAKMRPVSEVQRQKIGEAVMPFLTSRSKWPKLDKLQHKFAKEVLDLYGAGAPAPARAMLQPPPSQDAAKNALRMQIIRLNKAMTAQARQGQTLRTPAVVAFERERHQKEEETFTDMDQVRSADAKSVLYPAQAAHWKQVFATASARLAVRQAKIRAMRPPTPEGAAEVARYDTYEKASLAARRRWMQLEVEWMEKYAPRRAAGSF